MASRILKNQLVTPQSLLIETTAAKLAACFYEECRKQGMKSKHKTPQSFAKAHVQEWIPKAIQFLIDMLGKDSTPQDQKDMIYEALMERTNDPELSNCGIPIFRNDTPYLADKPVIYDQPTIDQLSRDTKNLQLKREGKLH